MGDSRRLGVTFETVDQFVETCHSQYSEFVDVVFSCRLFRHYRDNVLIGDHVT